MFLLPFALMILGRSTSFGSSERFSFGASAAGASAFFAFFAALGLASFFAGVAAGAASAVAATGAVSVSAGAGAAASGVPAGVASAVVSLGEDSAGARVFLGVLVSEAYALVPVG